MKNIILIGMPACGKSSIGVILAKTASMSFVDTDIIIQETENTKLQDIINSRGMDEFLKVEENALLSVDFENTVIATGGSAVYSENGMNHLKENGTVVYLKLPLFVIQNRLKNIHTRGIAMKPGETLADLYAYRKPFYERWADITIDCENLTVEEVVEAIIKEFE